MPLENVIEFLQANWVNLAIWAGIIALFVLLRNRATRIGGLDEVLGKGEPVIVELFSNTWTPCLLAKPIVDGLERELEGQARVVRLSILSKIGQEVAQHHGVRSVPTFLVFDNQGNLIERQGGFPDRNKIKALVTGTI